jgi:hypothetical protein
MQNQFHLAKFLLVPKELLIITQDRFYHNLA